MSKIIFAGCSFTSGTGFNKDDVDIDHKESPDLWVNLCSTNIDLFKNLTSINVSHGGARNSDIFEQAIAALGTYDDIKYLICAWTSTHRLNNIEVGFELYSTTSFYHRESVNYTHYLNNQILDSKYIEDCISRYVALLHIQREIVNLLRYINMIKKIAKNIKIININALCPWDDQFFVRRIDNFYASELTKFTQEEILNCSNRDDEEIYKLYNLQHDQYDAAGNIDQSSWVNLYNSFLNLLVDVNFDNMHPGIKSNQLYFNLVKKYIETNY